MITLEQTEKTYGKSSQKAVSNLSLQIRDGETFGFLGPNGAGKTTTIKMLCGILRPDSGRVLIDGIDISRDTTSAKQRIGLVPDNPEVFNNLKAWEYLNFVAEIYGISREQRVAQVEELGKLFKILDRLNNRISSFSHGMKQKLMVIASLIHDPHNWLLDEPMVGLDPEAAFDLKELMASRTAAGKCVFFSTHVLEVAERVCDRVGIIHKGELRFVGTVAELRAAEGQDGNLEDLFLNIVKKIADAPDSTGAGQ